LTTPPVTTPETPVTPPASGELPVINVDQQNKDKAILELINQTPTTPTTTPTTRVRVPSVTQPNVSDVASGSSGSPSAYGGADIAMLGDTSRGGLGSKISKKGGKYPWGEPEGTTSLKEGLGI
jgi:hypothetical protein